MYESKDPIEAWWQNKRKTTVLELIKQCNNISLLDVGCAESLYTRYLSNTRRCSVGIDISKPKLLRAKNYGGNNLNYMLADASKLPFSDNSFDMVICVDVIRYLNDPIKAVKELFRVSKKYVIIQSKTSYLRVHSSRFAHRNPNIIIKEFQSKPFAGDIWIVPVRALKELKYLEKGIKINKIIGIIPLPKLLQLYIFSNLKNSDISKKIVPIIDRLNDFLAEINISPFNNLGFFTTILFEKEEMNNCK